MTSFDPNFTGDKTDPFISRINNITTTPSTSQPFNPFQGGRASEENARGKALRSLGFKGDFNVGKSGFGGADFLKGLGESGQNRFNTLFNQFTNEANQPNSATGIVPIGVVEPLAPTTRQGIERIHGGIDNSANDAAIQSLLGLSTSAATPTTQAEFDAAFKRFSNPFQQQVIDRAISNIQRNEAIQQSQLSNRAQGANAFGGTAQGVQAGILGGETNRAIGDTTASLNAANFNQALTNALDQLQQDKTNQFTGAQIGSGVLSSGQNLRTSALQNLVSQGQAEIGAGGIVQSQNQRLLDAIAAERANQRSEPERQLQQALAVIQAFTGGGSGLPGQAGGSALTNALGGALVGNQFDLSRFLGGGGSSSSGGSSSGGSSFGGNAFTGIPGF